jgi:hypothetical protein
MIGAALLTLAGRELLNIITYEENPELEGLLTTALQAQGATGIVAITNDTAKL